MKARNVGLVTSALFALSIAAQAAEPFRLTSPDFQDNGVMPQRMGGMSDVNKNCLGQNVSPALAWTAGPEGTKSYVLMMTDGAGRLGQGVDHWLAYGIPAHVTKLAEAAGTKPQPFITGGKGGAGTELYYGPCPSSGTGLHHYVFMLVATDIEPGELKAGLTRAEILKAIAGRGKAVTDLVLRMGHPND